MGTPKRYKALRIIVIFLIIVLAVSGGGFLWLQCNYKRLVKQHLPEMLASGTDSIYHLTITDININFWTGNAEITGLHIWPDKRQAALVRARKQRIPPTLNTVFIPKAEIYGISWFSPLIKKTVDFDRAVIHDINWTMEVTPHPEDSLFPEKAKKEPKILRLNIAHGIVDAPYINYIYYGKKVSFESMIKGGQANLNQFSYSFDGTKDTSDFLYAKSGMVRPDSFIFIKEGSRYATKKPTLDFVSGDRSITWKDVKVDKLNDYNSSTGQLQEQYSFRFPVVTLTEANWTSLIDDGLLFIKKVDAPGASIDILYVNGSEPPENKMGDYPNDQLHDVGLKTNIKDIHIYKSKFRYTETHLKSKEDAVIELDDLDWQMTNVTNLDSVIRKNDNLVIKLKSKYNNKCTAACEIDLKLGHTNGRFTMTGYVEDIDAADINKQSMAYSLVSIDSLHVPRIDARLEGDETYVKGNMTMRYNNLKLTILKEKKDGEKKKRGLLTFAADKLLTYPANPLPGKEVRQVTTSFARDSTRGFVPMIIENLQRGAKKTAMRSDALINLTDGPETSKGEKPKKGFFKRIFGKHQDD